MKRRFKYKKLDLSQKEKDIINGLMLSDATIDKRDKNFSVTSSSKQFLMFIMDNLPQNMWRSNGIRTEYIYDKRIDKTLCRYRLISKSNEYFYELREKWYNDEGTKIIPKDIILSNVCNLMWYLGDGSLCQHHKEARTDGIKLCTNSFCKEDIEKILLPQLQIFSPYIGYVENKQPTIRIPRNKCELFLEKIGNSPFEDYSHKWKIYPYKNKNIENNGINFLSEDIKKEIIVLYRNGKTVTEIAKKFNILHSHVKYYCQKEGIYKPLIRNKTYEISLDNGETFEITHNLKDFCKTHELCYTNMIQLASGKIQKYKKIKIRKFKEKQYANDKS